MKLYIYYPLDHTGHSLSFRLDIDKSKPLGEEDAR